jgi:type IV secretory pathway VirD2 relaxase
MGCLLARKLASMTDDVTCDFRLEPGIVSDRGGGMDPQFRLFVNQVKVAVTKAGGIPDGRIQIREQRADNTDRSQPRKGRCCRIGRGQPAADRLKFMAGMCGHGDRSRRVIIKGRIVRLRLRSRAADTHLRYLQRDGTSRSGERGQLYAAETEEADGKAFVNRGRQDRRQFRFIIAAEDGDRLSDPRAFTRDVMRQMEKDLGTKLDWVAADHFNTGHPHTHVIVRGRDDLGKDLIIAQDYLSYGLRLRAQELVTLELGPETDREWRRRLRAEVSAERFTRIDRALMAEAKEHALDLRPQTGQVRADFDDTLRIGRLQVLARYGLAQETEPGVWNLSEDLEPTMRALGERCDIVKALNRALGARGQQRGLESYDLDGGESSIVGRLIDKRATDVFGRSIGFVIDGIDGRLHHVKLHDPLAAEEVPIGAIVEVRHDTSRCRTDGNIAQIAGDTGEYRASLHRAHAEAANLRAQDGDYDAFVGAHVHCLEALHRAGIVTRLDADRWMIPSDFEDRAAAYDAARGNQARVRILCVYDLDRQITSDGATWLDRELVRRNQSTLSASGFGAEVREALEQRKRELVRQGHVRRMVEGRAFVRTDLLETLQCQEVERIGRELAAQRGRTFQAIGDGQTVYGTLVGSAQLASGRFAMIDDGLGLSLVPWRPVIESKIGRQVMGVMCAGEISWQFGRGRALSFGP